MDSSAQGRERLLYVDNIRIVLVCLVIATHCAITYGAYGDWYFSEATADGAAQAVLTVMNAISQSFYMGLFFFISAYFIPASLDRKGRSQYLHDRFLRLGIPLVVWVLVISPSIVYLVNTRIYGFTGTFLESYRMHFVPFHGFGLGLMWFVFTLLVFTVAYAL